MDGCSTCRIRIGPAKHKYYYDRENDNVWKGPRGSSAAAKGEVLVLVKEDGMWIAYDVKNGAAREEGVAVWRTRDNTIAEGEHKWQLNRTRFESIEAHKKANLTDADLICTAVLCAQSAISDEATSRLRSRSRSPRCER